MKRFIRVLCIALAAAMSFVLFAACGAGAAKTEETERDGLTYVSLSAQTQVELVADANGTVLAANAVNADGEVLLAETELVGETVEDAAEKFTDAAVDLGYIDVDGEDNEVYVDVVAGDEDEAQETEQEITDAIDGYFGRHGIHGKAKHEDCTALADKAAEWGVTVCEAKLISRVLDMYPELTADEVLAMTDAERLELIKNDRHGSNVHADLRAEYRAAVEELKKEYAGIDELCAEIAQLEISLDALEGEERAEAEAALEQKRAKLDALEGEFRQKLDALRVEYGQRSHDAREHDKAEHDRRHDLNAGKMAAHEQTCGAHVGGEHGEHNGAGNGNAGSGNGNGNGNGHHGGHCR